MLVTFGFAVPAAAQSYLTRAYTIGDGLPSSEVYAVAQDERGRMWFTTRSGLVVYDGLSWTSVNRIKNPGMTMTKVRSDQLGMMWISDPSDDIVIAGYKTPFDLTSSEIKKERVPAPSEFTDETGFAMSAFAVGSHMNHVQLAVGLDQGGLWLWENKQWRQFGTAEGLPEGPVRSITRWNDVLLVAMDYALCSLKDHYIDCAMGQDLPKDIGTLLGVAVYDKHHRRNAVEPREPELWLLAQRALMKYKLGAFEIVEERFALDVADRFSTSLLPTGDDVFFGQDSRLFHCVPEQQTLEVLGRATGLAADGVTDLFLDRERNIWATSTRGVSKIITLRFTSYDSRTGLFEDEVSAICERSNGDIVFGHNRGLTIFDGSKFSTINLDENGSLQSHPPRVMDLLTDSRGDTYVVASRRGLGRLTGTNKIDWVTGFPKASDSSLFAIAETSDGDLMVGSNLGIALLKSGTDRVYTVPYSGTKDHPIVRRLFCKKDGTMLAATAKSGLQVFRDGAFEEIPGPKQASKKNMYTVFEDSQRQVWVGSAGGLLQLFDDHLISPRQEALHIDIPVYLIIEDSIGGLWFGTDDGIVQWHNKERHNYTIQDGLAGRETNRAAGLLDSRGQLWIGTDGGVSVFEPVEDLHQRVAPLVSIVSIETGDGRQVTDDGFVLHHHDNTLIFNYSGISFIDETRLRFRCRLIGYDEHWSDDLPAHQRSIRYTNIPPGSYRFSVQACNADGRWSEAAKSAELIIKKPYWDNLWFALIAIISGVFFVYSAARVIARWRYASRLEKEVTRRRIAESENQLILEELDESRLGFASIVEENVNGIIVVDEGGAVQFANAAAASFLGISRFDMLGQPCAVLTGNGSLREITIARNDGRTGLAAVNIEAMTWHGKPAQMVVLRDVTKQREAEEQLQQAQKLDAIGKLAGGVAHDFNNLLQAILSSVQFLRLNTGDAELQEETILDLERDIKQGASLTQRLLQFSRRDDPQMEVIDLNEMIRQDLSLLRRLIRENIEFIVELEPVKLPTKADRNQLSQVLTNLVVNACDSMNEGGRLLMRSGHHGDTEVWFDVSDTGRGIPTGIRTKIFEPFFTTKDRDRGTGLGLSVVHGIITHHGGRIQAESSEGQGARFCVFLPLAEGETTAQSNAPVTTQRPGSGEIILLVEDDDVIRRNLGEILSHLGYQVIEAASAEHAMKIPDEPGVDVLLTDFVLPGQRGDALALALRKRWPEISVVIMSGYADDEIMQQALQVDTATFLHKPFEIEQLNHVLHAALDPVSSASRVVVKEAPKRDTVQPMKILLAEDEINISNLLAALLKQQGHEVNVVNNGDDALRILVEDEQPLDLVISDLNLPKISGDELVKQCRQKGINVPFLLCSGDCDVEVSGKRVAFLSKPFDLSALNHAITSLFK